MWHLLDVLRDLKLFSFKLETWMALYKNPFFHPKAFASVLRKKKKVFSLLKRKTKNWKSEISRSKKAAQLMERKRSNGFIATTFEIRHNYNNIFKCLQVLVFLV